MLNSANLLANPEQNTGGNGLSGAGGNWVVSGSTVTIGAFSTFSELAAIVLPQSVQEVLGTNPMVVKIVQSVDGEYGGAECGGQYPGCRRQRSAVDAVLAIAIGEPAADWLPAGRAFRGFYL